MTKETLLSEILLSDIIEANEKVTKMISEKEGFIISEATLKISDLLQSAFHFMSTFKLNIHLQEDIKKVFKTKDDIDFLNYSTFYDPLNIDCDENASYLWHEDIFEYFNEITPEGYYFGSSEGDGSLFGWFKINDNK